MSSILDRETYDNVKLAVRYMRGLPRYGMPESHPVIRILDDYCNRMVSAASDAEQAPLVLSLLKEHPNVESAAQAYDDGWFRSPRKGTPDIVLDALASLDGGRLGHQRSMWFYRSVMESHDRASDFALFLTFTYAPEHIDRSREDKKWALASFFRTMRRAFAPVSYVRAAERGKHTQREHLHMLVWCTNIVRDMLDPVSSMGHGLYYRDVDIPFFGTLWALGLVTACPIRYSREDAWASLGMPWPVDDRGYPIRSWGVSAIGAYLTKELGKDQRKDLPWRVSASRGLGMTTLNRLLREAPDILLNPLTEPTRRPLTLHGRLSLSLPGVLVTTLAHELSLQRLWACPSTRLRALEAMKQGRPSVVATLRDGMPSPTGNVSCSGLQSLADEWTTIPDRFERAYRYLEDGHPVVENLPFSQKGE